MSFSIESRKGWNIGEKRVPKGRGGLPQELAQGFSSRIKIRINEDTKYRVYYMGYNSNNMISFKFVPHPALNSEGNSQLLLSD